MLGSLFAPLLPYGIALAALIGLYGAHKAEVALQHHAGYVQGRGEVQTAWDADKAQREAQLAAAQKRANDMALLAAQRLNDIELATRRQKEADRVAFDALANRARALPDRASIHLSDGAVRLWRDSAGSANSADAAGSPAEPAGAAAAVPEPAGGPAGAGQWFSERDLEAFNVTASAAYRAARAQWQGAVTAFDALRSTCISIISGNPAAPPPKD